MDQQVRVCNQDERCGRNRNPAVSPCPIAQVGPGPKQADSIAPVAEIGHRHVARSIVDDEDLAYALLRQ
jgi:hypothetical protein